MFVGLSRYRTEEDSRLLHHCGGGHTSPGDDLDDFKVSEKGAQSYYLFLWFLNRPVLQPTPHRSYLWLSSENAVTNCLGLVCNAPVPPPKPNLTKPKRE